MTRKVIKNQCKCYVDPRKFCKSFENKFYWFRSRNYFERLPFSDTKLEVCETFSVSLSEDKCRFQVDPMY